VWGLPAVKILLPFIIVGIATGSVYALAAMGLVLTYKTSGIFNFGHGAQAALSAFVMYELWQIHHWPWPVAGAASVALTGIVGGLILERMAFSLADKPPSSRVVATVGLLIALEGLIFVRYGSQTIQMPYFLPIRLFRVGGVNVTYEQLIVVIVALVLAGALAGFFRYSRLGTAMQAVVDDPALLGLEGTNPVSVRRSAWVIGSCFAALSGALLAPTIGLDATLLTLLVLQAFGAAAIGRFSSLTWTYVGGLTVGIGQSLLSYLVGQHFMISAFGNQFLQPWPANFPFLVLFGVLLFTPAKKLTERGARIVRRQLPPSQWPKQVRYGGAGLGALVLVVLPNIVSSRLPTYTTALAFVILFASLHLLVRTSGQVSLCQMAFAAVGATTYAHATSAGLPFPIAVLVGGLAAVPVGAIVAIPAIRLSGVFLAIATFGFGILVQQIFYPTSVLFGPSVTRFARRPSFAHGGIAYYYVVLIVTVLCCLIAVGVRRARLGRLLQGLADAPRVLDSHGGRSNIVRFLVFCISAFLAGIGGAIIGPITGSASAVSFDFSISLTIIAVLFIAGRRPLLAPFIAAALYVVGPSYIQSNTASEYTTVVFGLAAIIVACGIGRTVVRKVFGGERAGLRQPTSSLSKRRMLTTLAGES
jgi:branched-subunit amino acid ABC-type transport system permease component